MVGIRRAVVESGAAMSRIEVMVEREEIWGCLGVVRVTVVVRRVSRINKRIHLSCEKRVSWVDSETRGLLIWPERTLFFQHLIHTHSPNSGFTDEARTFLWLERSA